MVSLILTEDISDWAEETLRDEPDLRNKDRAIETQMTSKHSPQKMGRMIVAGRELGIAEASLIPPTKLLIQSGAARSWIETLSRETESVETKEGKHVTVRRFMGPVRDDAEEGEAEPWIEYNDPKAVELAEHYLLNAVPAHIRSRLNIIAANGGDIKAVAGALKREIGAMVAALS